MTILSSAVEWNLAMVICCIDMAMTRACSAASPSGLRALKTTAVDKHHPVAILSESPTKIILTSNFFRELKFASFENSSISHQDFEKQLEGEKDNRVRMQLASQLQEQ